MFFLFIALKLHFVKDFNKHDSITKLKKKEQSHIHPFISHCNHLSEKP